LRHEDVTKPDQHIMSTPGNSERFYDFGPFRVDVTERLLFRGNEAVQLTPKAFDLLLVFVESNGRVLTKEELMKRVWPDSFVEEANLSHNVYKLREALGEGGNGAKFIETLPRRGYRFVAKITERHEDDVLIVEEHSRARIVMEEESQPLTQQLALPPAKRQTPMRLLLFGGALIVAGLIAAWLFFWRQPVSPSANAPLQSVAVLPFKPLVSGDRNESLEMGMADTLINRLSALNRVVVRPTSSVRRYTDPQQDALAAGRELMVDSVLDGNIQKVGDQLRLTARLLRVSDGSTIWADKFDTAFTNIFSIQDDISEKVAGALAPKLSGEEKKGLSRRYTDNVEAYQLYLQGRYNWGTFTPDGFVSSINYYRAALEKDPRYALAYAGMAGSYSTIGIYGPMSAREAGPKALEAATKAVELDDQLAQAHTALGVVKLLYEWDWEGARVELERAIRLDPNTDGHTPYGYYLYMVGRWDEALIELKHTMELNPTWALARWDWYWALYATRRYDEAAAECELAIKLDPKDVGARWVLGEIQGQRQMYKEAISNLELANDPNNADLRFAASLGYVYAMSGRKDRALEIISQLKKSTTSIAPFSIAEVYVGLGDKDEAFKWLTKAYEEHYPFLCDFKVTPQFDALRSDPRYEELARRMNLKF
jgi:DNA-binding winged helix-turn-helix (wHTH) protein/TolB-like protein/tetratricopeptide (TPR) repeat protein